MEFLSGYGSGGESDSPAPSGSPIKQAVSGAPEVPAEVEQPASPVAVHLPPPARNQGPLFTGVPERRRARKFKKPVFGVPIDFGEVTPEIERAMKAPQITLIKEQPKGRSLSDMLPAPKHSAPAGRLEDVEGFEDDEESEVAALGANDGTAMYLGAAEPSGEDEAAATQEWAEPPRQPQQAPEVFAQDAAAVMGMDAFASAGIQFKEVNAASLREMAPGQRAELNATRAALGPGYEARLRKEAGPDVGKMAKRKHQITSLYQYAKLQELDQLEKNAVGSRNKAETKRKYGWG